MTRHALSTFSSHRQTHTHTHTPNPHTHTQHAHAKHKHTCNTHKHTHAKTHTHPKHKPRYLLAELSDAAYNTVQSFHSDSAVSFSIFLNHLPDMVSQQPPDVLLRAMQVGGRLRL
jgi:hypothetical protein